MTVYCPWLGKTGSGKSTLLNVLFSLGPLTAGIGLYLIVTFQYSSTALYQFSYHIQ